MRLSVGGERNPFNPLALILGSGILRAITCFKIEKTQKGENSRGTGAEHLDPAMPEGRSIWVRIYNHTPCDLLSTSSFVGKKSLERENK